MTVIKRLRINGDVEIKGEIIEEWSAIDDAQQVDDARQVDDSVQIDDSGGLESLLETIFGIQTQIVPVSRWLLDSEGNLYAPEFIEGSDVVRIKSDLRYEISGIYKEGGV